MPADNSASTSGASQAGGKAQPSYREAQGPSKSTKAATYRAVRGKSIPKNPPTYRSGGSSERDSGIPFIQEDGTSVLPKFNFVLRVEGAINVPCKAIKNLRRENEFEYIQEGGLNDYVHMKRKPISKPFTFQVERYAGIDIVDPLSLGTELTLPLLLLVYDRPDMGNMGVDAHRYYAFMGCTVTAKEYGDLDSENSGLVVETTTIAFREMVCIDNPTSTAINGDRL